MSFYNENPEAHVHPKSGIPSTFQSQDSSSQPWYSLRHQIKLQGRDWIGTKFRNLWNSIQTFSPKGSIHLFSIYQPNFFSVPQQVDHIRYSFLFQLQPFVICTEALSLFKMRRKQLPSFCAQIVHLCAKLGVYISSKAGNSVARMPAP